MGVESLPNFTSTVRQCLGERPCRFAPALVVECVVRPVPPRNDDHQFLRRDQG
jgi:hypothetical protein